MKKMKNKKIIKNNKSKNTNKKTIHKNKKMIHKNNNKSYVKNGEFIKLQCSPNADKNDFSCFNDESLNKLKNLWNKKYPNKSINSETPKDTWSQLKDNMSHICNKESCWLKQNFIEGKEDQHLMESFAPSSPSEWKKNPKDWLSSTDILTVMKQYEKAYKCFEFLGPSPIDFDTSKLYGECVWEELCHFNLEEQIKKGKNKFGIVFNLDPHYLGGSHWVSMFINLKRKSIFYFDSGGEEIPPRIKKFVDRIIAQGNALSPPIKLKFDQNYPIEHQYDDSECGIYTLYFISNMLEDKITEEYLKTHVLSDKYMSKFRKIYYNDKL